MKLQPWPTADYKLMTDHEPSKNRKCFQSLIMSDKGLSELETDKQTHRELIALNLQLQPQINTETKKVCHCRYQRVVLPLRPHGLIYGLKWIYGLK